MSRSNSLAIEVEWEIDEEDCGITTTVSVILQLNVTLNVHTQFSPLFLSASSTRPLTLLHQNNLGFEIKAKEK